MGLVRTEKTQTKQRNIRASDDNFARARIIAREFLEFAVYEVDAVCFEAMSHVRSSSSMAKIGMAYGMIAVLVELLQVPVLSATPQEVRKVLGATSKDDVARKMFSKYRHHGDSRLAIQSFLSKYQKQTSNHSHAWDSVAVLEAVSDSEVVRALRRRR